MSNYIRFLSQKIVKARKNHFCYECKNNIFPGEFYNRITYVYDEIYSLCFHLCCEKLAEEYRKDVGWNYYDDDDVCPCNFRVDCAGRFTISRILSSIAERAAAQIEGTSVKSTAIKP